VFNIRVIHLVEEVLDALIVFVVMHDDESYLAGCNEGRNEPLIESINGFQLHIGSFPFVLVHQIQGGMGNKLAQVPVVLFLWVENGLSRCYMVPARYTNPEFLVHRAKFLFVDGIIIVAHNNKVVGGHFHETKTVRFAV